MLLLRRFDPAVKPDRPKPKAPPVLYQAVQGEQVIEEGGPLEWMLSQLKFWELVDEDVVLWRYEAGRAPRVACVIRSGPEGNVFCWM